MPGFLIRKFIKNHENTSDARVRESYITLVCVCGLFFNMLLFSLKLLAGILSGSLTVMADAFNNLSDFVSVGVTLVFSMIARQPADNRHPYGHGRMEYLATIVTSVVIIVVAIEFFKISIDRIISPQPVETTAVTVGILLFSILVKLYMQRIYKKTANLIDSGALIAAALDSASDVIVTSVALIGIIASRFTAIPVDGYTGLLVSVFILKGGVDIARDTLDNLLGGKQDESIVAKIEERLNACEGILSVHDILLHSYGPGRIMGNAHAEVSKDSDLVEIHRIIDRAERGIESELGVSISVHIDPVDNTGEAAIQLHESIISIALKINPCITLHDFHIYEIENGKTKLCFDLLCPYNLEMTEDYLINEVERQIEASLPDCTADIRIDRRE